MSPDQQQPATQEIPVIPAAEVPGPPQGPTEGGQDQLAPVTPIDQARNPLLMTPAEQEAAAARQEASGQAETIGDMWKAELGETGGATVPSEAAPVDVEPIQTTPDTAPETHPVVDSTEAPAADIGVDPQVMAAAETLNADGGAPEVPASPAPSPVEILPTPTAPAEIAGSDQPPTTPAA